MHTKEENKTVFDQQSTGTSDHIKEGGGTLQITCIEGKLYRNTELIGKMDPYIVIEHQGNKYKTKVIKDGGNHVIWDDTFTLQIHSLDDQIKISCFDKDMIKDDLVGSKVFKASELWNTQRQEPIQKDWYNLDYKKSKSVAVLLETKFNQSIDSLGRDSPPISETIHSPHLKKAGIPILALSKLTRNVKFQNNAAGNENFKTIQPVK